MGEDNNDGRGVGNVDAELVSEAGLRVLALLEEMGLSPLEQMAVADALAESLSRTVAIMALLGEEGCEIFAKGIFAKVAEEAERILEEGK